jgi:hypothetical protein
VGVKIAIIYHSRISGGAHGPSPAFEGNPPIDFPWAHGVVEEQINTLYGTGLADAAEVFFIGLNGGMGDFREMKKLAPTATILLHGENAASELPTMAFLEKWLRDKTGWYVLYFHAKGVCWPPSKPGWDLRQAWRRCMTHHLIINWQRCILDLQDGYDMVGAHWLTADKYHHTPAAALKNGIWGGNFWWATSEYLRQLKPLQPNHAWTERYFAEMWPTNNRVPKVKDYAPHWPDLRECVISP